MHLFIRKILIPQHLQLLSQLAMWQVMSSGEKIAGSCRFASPPLTTRYMTSFDKGYVNYCSTCMVIIIT